MSADFHGPENGAADHSLWEPETVRPLGVVRAERERARQESETDTPSSENGHETVRRPALVPAAPSLPILPPDEWDLLKRIEKLEAAVANQESVIAMCVYVATTAADRAKGAA